jgi:hypothetical protein
MWERGEKTGIGWKERKKGAECAMRKEGKSNTWNGYSEMGGKERKERGEILNKDGRGIRKESPEDK